jgi:hypothetical protein
MEDSQKKKTFWTNCAFSNNALRANSTIATDALPKPWDKVPGSFALTEGHFKALENMLINPRTMECFLKGFVLFRTNFFVQYCTNLKKEVGRHGDTPT